MNKIPYPQLEETLYSETLPNGLQVYILPKQGFSKTYVTFTTRYGAVDNHFAVEGEKLHRVPDGIAHFLEHKMFEEADGQDVFTKFATRGASLNAFTSFHKTQYLFSATDQIEENLQNLLDFVQSPYFTDENVEKEKGIIAQEIKMYQDMPDQELYYSFLRAMYQRYPLNINVAGTVESIYEITKDDLYLCYNTFYHPTNMILIVVGGVDPDAIMELVRENQAAKQFKPQGRILHQFDPEPRDVQEHEVVKHLQVSMPKCYFGFKGTQFYDNAAKRLREETVMELLFDTLLSNSSPLFHKLYDQQLITDSFGASYGNNPQYAYSMFGGETKDPDAMIAGILAGFEQARKEGLSTEAFERARRKKMGRFLRYLDSPETMSSYLYEFFSEGIDPLAGVLPLYESITQDEALALLKTHFDPAQMVVSKVLPERKISQ